MLKLNLGSSRKTMEGFVNVDCRATKGVDLVWDLNTLPWPWEDNSVDEIHTAHCFEHLANPLGAITEARRVLKPGGKITIIVPSARGIEGLNLGHFGYFSRAWFQPFWESSDMQFSVDWMFDNPQIELHLFHWAWPFKPMNQKLIKMWENFWNATETRKILWDSMGIFPPNEIQFSAFKSLKDWPDGTSTCVKCSGSGLMGGHPCTCCGGMGRC